MPTLEELVKTVTDTKSSTEKLIGEFQKTHDGLKSLVVQQQEEIKSFGHSSGQTAKQVADMSERFEKLHTELAATVQESLSTLEQSKKRQDELEAQLKRGGMTSHGGAKMHNPGQKFIEDEAYKKFHEDKNPRTEKISVGSFWSQRKSVTGAADLRFMFSQYFDPEIYTFHSEDLRDQHIRDYITINRNAPAIVNFIRETNVLNNADFQVPASPNPEAAGAPPLKALSEYTFEKDSAQAATIAHGTPITKQLASDAPNLMNHINGRLRQGLFTKEDLVILFQAAATGKVTGITQMEDIQQFTRGKAGDTKIDNFRRSLTQLQIKGYIGNLAILAPEDWEEIELEKDDNKRYVWTLLSVPGFQEPILWRVPVFVTTAQTEGRFLTGDFKSGCTLWEHKEAYVQIFDQHADWALRNQLLILAEEEIIFTVEQPQAFVDGEFGKVGS